MKAKVIQEEYNEGLSNRVHIEDEGYRDSFEKIMLVTDFAEVEPAENYKNWFVFKNDRYGFMYHRSWLEFSE